MKHGWTRVWVQVCTWSVYAPMTCQPNHPSIIGASAQENPTHRISRLCAHCFANLLTQSLHLGSLSSPILSQPPPVLFTITPIFTYALFVLFCPLVPPRFAFRWGEPRCRPQRDPDSFRGLASDEISLTAKRTEVRSEKGWGRKVANEGGERSPCPPRQLRDINNADDHGSTVSSSREGLPKVLGCWARLKPRQGHLG